MARKYSKLMSPQSPAPAHSGLLASCLYLARHLKEQGLVEALQALREPEAPEERGAFFARIQETVRQAGLHPMVANLPWRKLADLSECLPVVVEFRGGHYRALSGIDLGQGRVELFPQPNEAPEAETLEQFRQVWTGGVFLFERINTALICFLLIAESAGLRLTQERLEQEYNLNQEEIPQNTLLRMAQDCGLQAQAWNCSWRDLRNRRQDWPAIARLKNGQHVVLVDMDAGQDGAPLIELSDPLSEGGYAHVTEQQFRAVWSGKVFLFGLK